MVNAIRWILGVFVMVFFGTTVAAGNTVQTDSLPPATHALQFQLAENFNFTSYAGGTLSLRRFREEAPDCRFGVSIHGGIRRHLRKEGGEPYITMDYTHQTVNTVNLRLIRQRLQSLVQRGPVTAYTALGWTLPLEYAFQPEETYYTTEPVDDEKHGRRYETWTRLRVGAGIQVNLGVEIRHAPWVYSFVEYGLRSEFTWTYSHQTLMMTGIVRKRTDTSNAYGVSLETQALTLGLAIMF